MATISNFTQAMKELTGFDENPSNEKKDEGMKETKMDFQPRESSIRPERPRHNIEMPVLDNQDSSIVTSTMIIKGNIEGKDSLKVDGKVSGNISMDANLISNGTIVGDIKADSISTNGPIKGNINAKGNLKVGTSAVIAGDISSRNIEVDGKIKGNITVRENSSVAETAWISGDVSTGSIVTDIGCVINGNVTTKDAKSFNIDEEKLFGIGE